MTSPRDLQGPAVRRLIAGVEPLEVREILGRCLSGTLSPAAALMQMLIETEDAAVVRAAVDEVTARAATLSRATDNILRDRVDDLTQLVVENEPGYEEIARTQELVTQLEEWGIISPEYSVLDIGCGIGSLVAELALRSRDVSGVDASAQMIHTAVQRCARLSNVRLLKGSGHDLREFGDDAFDTAIAVDTFPYIRQSGVPLVETYFAEAARVLKPGGHLVIMNYSYSGDDTADAEEVAHLARDYGFDVVISAQRPFTLWNGLAFHLKRRTATI